MGPESSPGRGAPDPMSWTCHRRPPDDAESRASHGGSGVPFAPAASLSGSDDESRTVPLLLVRRAPGGSPAMHRGGHRPAFGRPSSGPGGIQSDLSRTRPGSGPGVRLRRDDADVDFVGFWLTQPQRPMGRTAGREGGSRSLSICPGQTPRVAAECTSQKGFWHLSTCVRHRYAAHAVAA